MTITLKALNTFGYISIGIMTVMLLLLWFNIVPQSLTIPFFVVALGLFLVRLVLRIRLAMIERKALRPPKNRKTPR
jgi:hypothetical protein